MTNTDNEKKYYVSLVVKDSVLPANARPEDFTVEYVGEAHRKELVYKVPVNKELSLLYKRDDERTRKRKQRGMKNLEKGKAAPAVPLSIDYLSQDSGIEPQSSSCEFELSELRVAFEQLVEKIEKIHPSYGRILRLTAEGLTQRQIATALGKSQSTIKEQQAKALDILRELYKL